VDRLSATEGRVVASLVEKALTVPQYYPLTLNALVAACNQTSNRDPVTALSDADVLAALESLREKHLVRQVLPSHGRSVVRYRQVLEESLGLDAPGLAVLAVLVLRGPQTSAELRIRTERMADVGSVDHELELLSERTPPLVARVGRRPGQKEDRWAATLADGETTTAPATMTDTTLTKTPELDDVRAELAELRDAVAELRAALTEVRATLGG
jgi:uncharacterized protein